MIRAFVVLGMLAACRAAPSGPPPTADHPSSGRASSDAKLVVLLVIDQWPEWAFEAKRPAFVGGGFDRLLSEGAWHVGEHPSAATLTAPGHALLGTGEPPSASGILANEWYHRDLEHRLHSVEDAEGSIGAAWLRVPGLGDALARAHPDSRAVAVSLKDRSAILPLGHAGTPLWYDKKTIAWTTNANPPPAWLGAYNTAHPIEPHLHAVWEPLDAARLAALAKIPDDQPGEVGGEKLGVTFPHAPDASGDPADALQAQPLGDAIVLDAALAAIDGEHLGAHAVPDLLVVSLSTHDYIGHGWGQESWEMWDDELRLDRALAGFLAELDRRIGAGRWAMIATSDHGANHLAELAGHGGRMTFESLKDAANRAAIGELGPGDWVADTKYPSVFFTKAFFAQPEHDRAIATKKVIFALRAFPGIERVARTADLAGHCETRTGDARAFCLAIDPERTGDLVYFLADNWIVHEAADPTAASHGSHHLYDRRVPLLVLAPGRVAHAPLAGPDATIVPMADVSTMLADWLHVTPPRKLPR